MLDLKKPFQMMSFLQLECKKQTPVLFVVFLLSTFFICKLKISFAVEKAGNNSVEPRSHRCILSALVMQLTSLRSYFRGIFSA